MISPAFMTPYYYDLVRDIDKGTFNQSAILKNRKRNQRNKAQKRRKKP